MEVWNSCWVFAYGSLLWDPGFEYIERKKGTLHGYKRDMCMYSYEARGDIINPGLVLGLKKGGHTHGFVFKVKEEDKRKIFEYLLYRENHPLPCYFPLSLPVHVHSHNNNHTDEKDGCDVVSALCFVSDPDHEQYANITEDKQVTIITTAVGKRGTSFEYLQKTVVCMQTHGIIDTQLELLLHQSTNRMSSPYHRKRMEVEF